MPFDVVDMKTGCVVKIYWITVSNIGLPQGLIFTGKTWKFVNMDNYISMDMYEAIMEDEHADSNVGFGIYDEYDESFDKSFTNIRCRSIGEDDDYIPDDEEYDN